jgi:MSHA biogenesis protein MshQ
MLYGFIGYALVASTTAEEIEYYPPNRAPEISDAQPADGEQNVPISLSELQFRIQDDDGELMSYSVTTDPDIGSANGNLKPFGVYSVPVSGLKTNSLYKWTVEVTDGKQTTAQEFSFNTPEVPFNPFDEGWQYRKQISIQHSQVAGNLSNFPVLIHTIDADLHTKAQPDGDDILFMDGSGVAHKLYHEIESYETSNGELLAWVNIMNLAADEDTVLYMYYGNPDSVNGQMSERVWDPYFAGVWHLMDFQDSTKNGNHGTNYGSTADSGKIGDARAFDGSDDDIIVDDDPSLNFHTPNRFSISMWVKRDRLNTYESIISKATSAHMAGYAVQIRENNTILFVLFDGSQEYLFHSHQVIVDTNWHYVTAVWDGTQQEIFIDGIVDNTINIGDVTVADDSKPLEFGHHYGYIDGKNPFDGSIDEVQISKVARNADWISTSYMNQQNPFTFMNFGPEEPGQ